MDDLMKKHEMTEEDIKLQFITPAIEGAGWDRQKQIKMEYNFTDGRGIVRGNVTARGKRKRTDYLLFYKPNLPLAIVEAKDNRHSLGAGMQQGIEYAQCLDVPFVYSSNGDGFAEHDFLTGTEREFGLDESPTEAELIARFKQESGLSPAQETVIDQPYYSSQNTYPPRYYQRIAINRTMDAIARGQQRLLLVMAALCAAAGVDLTRRRIPNLLSVLLLAGFAVCTALDFLLRRERAAGLLLAGVLGGVGLLAVLGLCRLISRGGIGMGDIKLFSALSLLLGLYGGMCTLILAQLAALVCAVVLLLARKATLKDSIPFAPFFAVGFLLCLILGTY